MLREKISVCWQNAFYHITIVFVHDDTHIFELQKAFDRVYKQLQMRNHLSVRNSRTANTTKQED